MRRRAFLQAVSVATLGGGSGCLDAISGQSRYLEALNVRNDHDTAHELGFTVERGGEVIREMAVEVPPSQGPALVECEWSGQGSFVVTCTLDGDQTRTVDVEDIEEGAGKRADVTFLVTTLGELSSYGIVDDGGLLRCPEDPWDDDAA